MIRNPKYKPSKKNGGIVPAVSDERILHVPIGCGKCMECMKQKTNEWRTRLIEDIKHNTTGRFVTLTFSDESIRGLNSKIENTRIRESYTEGVKRTTEVPVQGYDRDNAIAAYAVRHFLERWRKKYKKSLRHWLVTELGHKNTERIHLHGIIWQPETETRHWLEFLNEVEKVWQYGWVWKRQMKNEKPINYVSAQTINYCVKYVTKIDADHKGYKPIMLCSAGIGGQYTQNELGNWTRNKYKEGATDEGYRTGKGFKIALPIYWRNKIYTDEEKEKLWIEKLNKQERWVGGERVSVKYSEDEYYKLLEHYRKINAQLGYGDDKKNWTRAKYEHERRRIIMLQIMGKDYPKEWDNF